VVGLPLCSVLDLYMCLCQVAEFSNGISCTGLFMTQRVGLDTFMVGSDVANLVRSTMAFSSVFRWCLELSTANNWVSKL
jgi:hypothetical protein